MSQYICHLKTVQYNPHFNFCIYLHRLTKIVLIGVAIAAFAIFLAFDTIDSRRRLQSLIGIGVLLLFGFVFSKNPTKVRQLF